MNKKESDILNTLLLEPFINQRILAERPFPGHREPLPEVSDERRVY